MDPKNKPVSICCAGDYCKRDFTNINTAEGWPEFHIDEFLKIQTEKEKQESRGLAVKSFTPDQNEVILPELPNL